MKDLSKVFFITDMDGTLLPTSKKLNPTDLEAIAKFRHLGGHFSVATGRSIQSASQYFGELQLDEPAIVCNGGGIYDCREKKFAWQKFVDTSAYEIVKGALEKFPYVGCEISYSDKITVLSYSDKEEYHLRISYGGNYEEGDIASASAEGWCKLLFAAEPEELPDLIKFVSSFDNDKLSLVQSSKFFYEILPTGCTKGSALKLITEIYKMNGWKIAACGDFDNDLAMLEFADIAISPSNAQECVKNVSDYVTKADCSSGAIAEALEYVMNVL